MADEFNAMASEAHGAGFDPSEMSEEVGEEAHREAVDKSGRGEPLGRPEEFERDDEDPGDPMEEDRKPEPKAPPRMYRAKANGRDIEVPADHVDAVSSALGIAPEDFLRGTQMFKAGQERIRQAAEKEKAAQILKRAMVEGAQGELSKESRRAMREAGIRDEDVDNFAIKRINELIEIERLQRENPAELERRRTQAELEELQARKQAEEQSMLQDRATERLNREISSVLEKNQLPRDPYYVSRLAAHMIEQLEKGVEADDLHAADFVPLVLDRAKSEFGAFLERMSGEDLIKHHPKMADKIRQAYAKKVRRDGPPSRQPEGQDREANRQPRQRERASTSEVLRRWREGR